MEVIKKMWKWRGDGRRGGADIPDGTTDAFTNTTASTFHHLCNDAAFEIRGVETDDDVSGFLFANPDTTRFLRECTHVYDGTTTICLLCGVNLRNTGARGTARGERQG